MVFIENSEILARFISRQEFISNNSVKGIAFLPRENRKRDDNRWETSVNRHDGNNLNEVKSWGEQWASLPFRKKPLQFLGWADVAAGTVRTVPPQKLEVEADEENKGNPRHANIIGWNLDRGQREIEAEELARRSVFRSV